MTLQITGKNLDVGDAMRTYVQDRIAQIFDKYLGREPSGHVRIEKEHGQFRTACSVHLWQGATLEAHGDAADPHQSADLACERLDKRLRRYKRRLKAHGGMETVRNQWPAASYVIQSPEEEGLENEDGDPVIIAESETVVHEMSVSDAVMQMDLSDYPVVVFRNAGNNAINLVYRRADGNIGWLDLKGLAGDDAQNDA
ncbi:ribosome hibernation-promoting factor, HPF/YfiA family [Methyloligella solikamskensis]|uniref:Ribosome hibernation promoting factor n=1 Tax=Methyloligella solikamskensis TaxID=1177756 RepID=A0ABW3J5R3_9HYPH